MACGLSLICGSLQEGFDQSPLLDLKTPTESSHTKLQKPQGHHFSSVPVEFGLPFPLMMPINNLCITPLIEMEKENLAKDIAVETMVTRKRLKGEGNRERLADGHE